MLSVIVRSVIMQCVIIPSVIMQCVIMRSVFILSVIMLSDIILTIRKELLSRINQIYYWRLFCTKYERYNYFQLI